MTVSDTQMHNRFNYPSELDLTMLPWVPSGIIPNALGGFECIGGEIRKVFEPLVERSHPFMNIKNEISEGNSFICQIQAVHLAYGL